MKNLKKPCCRKAAKCMHTNEGVRVNGKTRKDTRNDAPSSDGSRNKILAGLAKILGKEAISWCIQNWPFVCDSASRYFEAFIGMFSS